MADFLWCVKFDTLLDTYGSLNEVDRESIAEATRGSKIKELGVSTLPLIKLTNRQREDVFYTQVCARRIMKAS